MKAMRLYNVGEPLRLEALPNPQPSAREVLVRVLACGVCRTDLHIVDGELRSHRSPLIPGHEIVGQIIALGTEVCGLAVGQRVGIPWLGHTCGCCPYCRSSRENLCDRPQFTGYDRDGGYAELATADAEFCFPLPQGYADAEIAPLLCAGLIGFRSYRHTGDASTLGLFGFGAAAHIICQVAIADALIGKSGCRDERGNRQSDGKEGN